MARAKEFDEDAVLLKVMNVFWEQGYEKTSINDLVESMGIHRRSMYDTFGDKHQLFLKVIQRYNSLNSRRIETGLSKCDNASEVIRFLFEFMIDGNGDTPPGCMFVNIAVELALRNPDADAKASESFNLMEEMLIGLIRKGQESGEFTAAQDAEELAENIHTVMIGVRAGTNLYGQRKAVPCSRFHDRYAESVTSSTEWRDDPAVSIEERSFSLSFTRVSFNLDRKQIRLSHWPGLKTIGIAGAEPCLYA